jgi:ribosomal protein S2
MIKLTQEIKKLLESSDKGYKKMTITYRDTDHMLEKIIEGIKDLGNPGHSFSIVLDPDGDHPIKCGWDGDGSCMIKNIEIEEE